MGVKKLTVIVKRVGRDAVVEQIDPGLKGWQGVVKHEMGSYVQVIPARSVGLPEDVDIAFNEEGKVYGMPFNFWLTYPGGREIWDDVRGDAFFMARKGDKAVDLPVQYHQAVFDYLKERTHAQ